MGKCLARFVAILIIISFIAALSVSCSDTEKKDKLADEDLNMMIDDISNQETINYYCPNYVLENFSQKVCDEIEKRTRDTLNIKLKINPVEGANYGESIKALLSSGAGVGMFYCNGSYIPDLVQSELLLDISSLFPKNAPDLYGKFSKMQLEEVSYNGDIYAIPRYMINSLRLCVIAWEDMIKKYNIEKIDTLEDYENYLALLKEKEKSLRAPMLKLPMQQIFTGWTGQAVIERCMLSYKWDDPDVRLVPWEQTDVFREAVDMLKRWYSKGYIAPPEREGYITTYGNENSELTIVYDGLRLTLSTMAKQPYGKPVAYPLYSRKDAETYPVSTAAVAFSRNTKNAERAIRFINWVHSSQENYDLFVYGIEGDNYTIDNGVIDTYNIRGHAGWSGTSPFSDLDLNRLFVMEPPGLKEIFKKDMEHSSRYPSGSAFWSSEEGYEAYNKYKLLIDSRAKSFTDFVNSIKKGNSNIDEFIKAQKDAGADELVKEMQVYWDKWRRRVVGS